MPSIVDGSQVVRRCLGVLGRRIGARARTSGAASIVGLLVAGWPAVAGAAPFELAWSAPEGCPSREEIVDATYARLEESRSERPPELFVEGAVVENGDQFIVTLVLADASGRSVGERVVNVDERACSAVLIPTAVVLAMMISVACPPDAQADQPPQPASSEATTPSPDQGLPVRRPRRRRATANSPTPDPISFGAAVVGSTAILPDFGVGLLLHASYFPRSEILLRLEASFEEGNSVEVARGDVGFHLWSVGGRAGLVFARTKRFDLVPTLGGRVGLLQTSASGFKVPLDDASIVATVGPGVVARAKLGSPITLEAFLDGELVLRRDRYQVIEGDKLHHIHEPHLLGVRLGLGLAYDFR